MNPPPPSHSPATLPSDAPAAPAAPAIRLLLAASVVLIALNLRPVFSSLSVLLPEIMKSVGLTAAGASVLTMLPVLCLGLFAPAAPALEHHVGMERTLLGCLLLVTLGTLLRGAGSAAPLFVGSALAGIGIAVANVLMPVLVKRDFPRHVALMMGLYTMWVPGGAAIAAGLTVPLEHALAGGWTRALAAWAVPAAVVTLLWAPYALSTRSLADGAPRARVRGLTRDRLAWQVTLFMGLQSALAYIVMGWLAPILRARGLDAATAGYVLSASTLVQIVTCLALPALAVRRPSQSGLALGVVLVTLATLLACQFGPLNQVWVWAIVLGAAQGAGFALALTLIVLRSPDARVASQLSAMAQGVGYLIAAVGPLLVGLLRGWTGSFDAAAWLYLLIAAVMAASGIGAGRARHVLSAKKG
ncbi:MAG: putative MFS-type transporter [Burkholderiaceae bacterium]|jgi:CP family cyanate transporter-like MFS transporter|nr:MAG: putative MFS-type transporter [Burkholderiaceae bacterium]